MGEGSADRGDLLDAAQVAERLGVGRVTVWRWCRTGHLPCEKADGSWRVRREDLEDFLERSQQPATLTGELSSFLDVPDNLLGIARTRELMHRLDATFFRVGEERGGLLVKLYGGEPGTTEEDSRQELERYGLDASRLEAEGRLRLLSEQGSQEEREAVLRGPLGREAGGERAVWASFNWARQVDLDEALSQQEALTALVEGEFVEGDRRLVVMTVLLEEIFDDWPPEARRRARWEVHSGTISLSEGGMVLSRLTPLAQEE